MGTDSEVDPSEICRRRSVSAQDVARMRRSYYAEGIITEAEADAIFAINHSCPSQCPEWADLFVEALTDYVVHQASPQGYVTAEKAEWLIERISLDGIVQSATELELLVHVLDAARWAPERLVRFALAQVLSAVTSGTGPLRSDGRRQPGAVTAADVVLLRRILYAFGGDGNIAVTQAEAEMLFAINDRAEEGRSDPAWTELFVKAIANHLMAVSGYQPPPREQALREEHWLSEESEGVGDFLARMLEGGIRGVLAAYKTQDAEEIALERLERQRVAMVTSEAISEPEARWLAERIGRDGKLSLAERALLAFIKAESPRIDPVLEPLLARAA